jgi:transcription initiation factor IIE alpha subunit
MKKLIILAVLFLVASPALFAQAKAGKKDTLQHTSLYTCPMHSDVASKQPGKCPKCGMDLVLTSKEQMKMDVVKNYTCPVHLEVTKHDPGKCPICGKKLNLSPKEQMKSEVVKIYTCPMHPDVALDKDGKCPKCGAALVEKKQLK